MISSFISYAFAKLRVIALISYVGEVYVKASYGAARSFLYYSLVGILYAYRYFISPLLPASCKFLPTCSQYMLDAIRHHGPVSGAWLAICRVCRCHPWQESRYDPVISVCAMQTRNDNLKKK